MNQPTINKPRILTGDTPTGRLHLGHWVGSLENRVAMQSSYECFFIIANVHAFTTRAERPEDIRQSVLEIATDYLACGIDPNVSTIFLQSEIPAIAELTFFFAMLVPFARLMRNPTLKDEIRDKGLGDSYSFGFCFTRSGRLPTSWPFGLTWCRWVKIKWPIWSLAARWPAVSIRCTAG